MLAWSLWSDLLWAGAVGEPLGLFFYVFVAVGLFFCFLFSVGLAFVGRFVGSLLVTHDIKLYCSDIKSFP